MSTNACCHSLLAARPCITTHANHESTRMRRSRATINSTAAMRLRSRPYILRITSCAACDHTDYDNGRCLWDRQATNSVNGAVKHLLSCLHLCGMPRPNPTIPLLANSGICATRGRSQSWLCCRTVERGKSMRKYRIEGEPTAGCRWWQCPHRKLRDCCQGPRRPWSQYRLGDTNAVSVAGAG